jgi:hypothetical protein
MACVLGSSVVFGVPARPSAPLDNLNLAQAAPCTTFMECLQKDMNGRNSNFYEYVQIGANVGDTSLDPVAEAARKSKWKGLLVEPDPAAFAVLSGEDRDRSIDGYKYEQVVIGSQAEATNGTITFYSVSPDVDRLTSVDSRSGASLPPTVTRLSSTSRAYLLEHAAASFSEKGLDAEQYITGELAQCKDVNQILTESEVGSFIKEHGGPLETFRLLMVDTEEHNAKVLMALDLDQRAFLPHYLTYKTNSLTADEIAQLETKLSAKFQHRETDADSAYWWREPTNCDVTDCTATAATSFAARSR